MEEKHLDLISKHISTEIKEQFTLNEHENSSTSQKMKIGRINFLIGENNSGKSKFLRGLFISNVVGWKHDKNIKFKSRNNDHDIFTCENTRILKCNYIPILRGLRPLIDKNGNNILLMRTIKDYFSDYAAKLEGNIINLKPCDYRQEKDSIKEIIAIENFIEIKESNKSSIYEEKKKNYEEKLSQYFFNDRKISIYIPNEDRNEDVIKIMISGEYKRKKSQDDDDSINIYDVGDGIGQILFLTYKAFMMNKDEEIFFIEEPETNLHPRMLKQLILFFLKETNHFYFFTTHSNHLLDMKEEDDDNITIYKFKKRNVGKGNIDEKLFELAPCEKYDYELLNKLGAKPSSVYLANSSILVEGLTDRLYIELFLQKYIKDNKKRQYKKDFHYNYIEYSGSNLSHWDFKKENNNEEKQKVLSIANNILVICDGDVRGKKERKDILEKELNDKIYFLESKEIENLLPKEEFIEFYSEFILKKQNKDKQEPYIILKEALSKVEFKSEKGLGELFTDVINDSSNIKLSEIKNLLKNISEPNGTLCNKIEICKNFIYFIKGKTDFQLSEEAKLLCEKIYEHIEECNPPMAQTSSF